MIFLILACSESHGVEGDEPVGAERPLDTAVSWVDSGQEVEPAIWDCSAIHAKGDWWLCDEGVERCEVAFQDGAGCAEVCASVGLVCTESYDNVDGQCAADTDRPALGCADLDHQSDYCVCTKDPADPIEEEPEPEDEPADPCDARPYDVDGLMAEREGFGANTTGGDPDNLYVVTTRNDGGSGSLRAGLESAEDYWIVFDVEGEFVFDERIRVKSNKTVDGRGVDVTLRGNLYFKDVHNVILTDLKLTNDLETPCTQEGDVITVYGEGGSSVSDFTSHDYWFHHLELYNGGDGLLDLRGATNVTLSWSHLHTHKKAMLMWKDKDQGETAGMQVTMHHNWFDRLSLRGPQFFYGKLHYYNNWQYEWYEYGAGSFGDAELLSEKNVYQARPGDWCWDCPDPSPCGDHDFVVSKVALTTEWADYPRGNIVSNGDLVLEDARLEQRGSVFTPGYAYTLEGTSGLTSVLGAQTGPRTDYCD